MALDGFAESTFTHDGATRTVYRRGAGPGVVIMHEIPGIHPDVARFATRVADEGFTAVMPELFGETGKAVTPGYDSLQRALLEREGVRFDASGRIDLARHGWQPRTRTQR